MTRSTPIPQEGPALRIDPVRKDARRPLIVFGALGEPGADGLRPVERVPLARGDVFLGPLLGRDGQSFEEQIAELMIWRAKAIVLRMAGIVVTQWNDLDLEQRDLVLQASRDILGASGPRTHLGDEPPAELFRLPVWGLAGAKLVEVKTYSSGYKPQSLREKLESMAPTAEAFSAGMMSIIDRTQSTRDFDAACRVAADLHANGRSGVQISKYLTAYGYENSRRVPGAWHYARLTEALTAGTR